jgi:hypothetical protein
MTIRDIPTTILLPPYSRPTPALLASYYHRTAVLLPPCSAPTLQNPEKQPDSRCFGKRERNFPSNTIH